MKRIIRLAGWPSIRRLVARVQWWALPSRLVSPCLGRCRGEIKETLGVVEREREQETGRGTKGNNR
jgi:hypothetical protein